MKKTMSVILSMALAFSVCAPVLNAGDKKTAPDNGSFTGTFARDGNNILFRVSKTLAYLVKPGDSAQDGVKKQLDLTNVDTLTKSTWKVTGKLDGKENGLSILKIDSLTQTTAKKKK